jgi:hypothetical protein
VCAAAKLKAGQRLMNPSRWAADAAEAFERFHGHPPSEDLVFESLEHEHTVFVSIGELIELAIVPEDGDPIDLKGFEGAQLAMNKDAIRGLLNLGKPLTQLYIIGGDTSLAPESLEEFGLDLDHLHEQEVLGKCIEVTYFTDKTHLGKDGGLANYVHQFGEEEAEKRLVGEKHLEILASPTATYDVVNGLIGLWGGKYTIEAEGIRN